MLPCLMQNREINIYIVRHGNTEFNTKDIVQGWSNSPLTPLGVEQVISTAQKLADIKFDAVYSSSLERTVQTAKILVQHNNHNNNTNINRMPEFREMCFGHFELGPNKIMRDAIIANVPPEYKDIAPKELPSNIWIDACYKADIGCEATTGYNAEDLTTIRQRLKHGLNTIINNHRDKNVNVLVVSHGIAIREIFMMLNLFENYIPVPNNAAYSIVKYDGKNFSLVDYNN